jgi:asparagine synthase (glutamine-hydrolysing)
VRERRWLVAGRDAMRHRGPDDAGEWWSADGCVGLAHRRLAVIDLTPAGHQPMADVTDELHIVYNGEIYNFVELRTELQASGYAFRTGSDTEVILNAYRQWGTDCLPRLNGMFAFALYDARRRELFMARDRAGEKPLFYCLAADTLRFASELKGLMAAGDCSRRIDPEALDCYLGLGFVPGQRCILRGINKLPPAHALLCDMTRATTRVWRYWQLPEFVPPGDQPDDDAALLAELEVLLADSVKRQLVADVPVGVLLSGGVDSSLVTAMAARATARLKTFTVRFPGYAEYDETAHARLIAAHYDTDHTELDGGTASVDLLVPLARQFDEPMVDSSMVPTFLVSRLVRQHCTVALGGDGGDEMFGGYPRYSRLLWLQQRLAGIPRSLRRGLAGAAQALLPVGCRGRNWLPGLASDLHCDLPQVAACFDRRTRARLLGQRVDAGTDADKVWEQRVPATPDLLQRATRMDFENYLAEDLLVKVDRASMLSSLEVRAPLLDHRLIEFAFARVPPQLKATPSSRKVLLKKLAARVLPKPFDQQRKQGFSLPLAALLRSGAWRAAFHDMLLGPDCLFDRGTTGRLLAGQARGRANSERLFALVLFELWRREYQVSL